MKLLLARALTGAFDATLQVVCGALLACLAVALPSVWLGGKGVHPLRAVLGFLGLQPRAGRLVLCALLCLGVYVGGSKVDSSPRRAAPSAQVASLDDGGDGEASAGLVAFSADTPAASGLFPDWVGPVTNLCFTGVHVGEAAVSLRLAWPAGAAGEEPAFEVYSRADLSLPWELAGVVPVGDFAGSCVVRVPRDASASARFYTFGVHADSDGDGLSDAWEALVSGTDPSLRDTDRDGLSDAEEPALGLDPLDPYSNGTAHSDGLAAGLGGADPLAVPPGGTYPPWQVAVYGLDADGDLRLPRAGAGIAVLEVKVQGTVPYDILADGAVWPLVPDAGDGTTVYVPVPRGVRVPLVLRWNDRVVPAPDVPLEFRSDDFAFGELPAPGVDGWICFPRTDVTPACFHGRWAAREVRLLAGDAEPGLSCTWRSDLGSAWAVNLPPCAAILYAMDAPPVSGAVHYTLSHPRALFGDVEYEQPVMTCPRPRAVAGSPSGGGSVSGGGLGDGSEGAEDPWFEPPCASCGCPSGACAHGCSADGGCGCATADTACGCASCSLHAGGGVQDPGDPGGPAGIPDLPDVLLLHARVDDVRQIALEVPEGRVEGCGCPCPEHASHHVACWQRDRLEVLDAAGGRFETAYATCRVTVRGQSPSREPGDARLVFTRDGEVCQSRSFTVLGVDVAHASLDLDRLEALDVQGRLGVPFLASDNPDRGLRLSLLADVGLDFGHVRVALEPVTDGAAFRVRLPDVFGDCSTVLLDSTGGASTVFSVDEWRAFVRDGPGGEARPVVVTASAPGSCRLILSYEGVWNGRRISCTKDRLLTALPPPVLPDYGRDGSIGDADAAALHAGRVFRFWTNEDPWKGDEILDQSPSSVNGLDGHVNGRYDLQNLFPLRLDFHRLAEAWGGHARFTLWAGGGGLRACPTDAAPSRAGGIYVEDVLSRGGPLHEAGLSPLSGEGLALDPAAWLGGDGAPAVAACESSQPYCGELHFIAEVGGMVPFVFSLPVSFSSVRDMYRWANLRDAVGGAVAEPSRLGVPDNNPDSECLERTVFFSHGFNVDEPAGRNWGDQVFKRLWLAGSRARFCAVTWHGDYRVGEDRNPMERMNGFFYHEDVCNALDTAPTFRALVESVEPVASRRVVMAQSLGNMMASEALRLGLEAGQYLMFNAAVPSEAYVAGLQDADAATRSSFVPEAWRAYAPLSWAANWFRHFPSDGRGGLGWPGRFAGALANVESYCNYYSTGDSVLVESATPPSFMEGAWDWRWPDAVDWHWPFLHLGNISVQLNFERYAWQKQEVLKGVDPYVATLRGGWRFACTSVVEVVEGSIADDPVSVWWVPSCTAAESHARVADGSVVTAPVFDGSVPGMFDSGVTPAARNRILAYNVPAVSPAAGSRALTEDTQRNKNLNSEVYRSRWGRDHRTYGDAWLHSDMKDMAYFYVHGLYRELVSRIEEETDVESH